MIRLRFQFNAILKTVAEGDQPGSTVIPVITKTGSFERIVWAGFIDIEDARSKPGAKPVKLDLKAYSVSVSPFPKWIDLSPSEAVQGCITTSGVYAVVDSGRPRIVSRKPAIKD